ncbi:hypothetical protein [Tunturiibacter psychrotolerans]|uniref:hypothetical protein n=1 Tax=Tunturiibacter psychrotolerans TaxID=3069686 RepID=UPI003D1C7600
MALAGVIQHPKRLLDVWPHALAEMTDIEPLGEAAKRHRKCLFSGGKMKSFRTIFARDLDSASLKGENQGLPAGGATVQTTTVMGDALEGYLDLTSQQLTGSNMANIDTPAYKTLAFNFESEFTRQLHDQAWVHC